MTRWPGTPPDPGGRGRSSGPGCAARVATAAAVQPCTPPTIHSRTRWCSLMVSFYRSFSSRSSVSASAGLKTGLSAVDAGCPAPFDQSGDLGERAVSLGRDYIDVMGLAAIDVSASSYETLLGCLGAEHGNRLAASCRCGLSRSWGQGGGGPWEREAANGSRQGPVAGDQQVGEPCVKPWRNVVGSERRGTGAFCSALTNQGLSLPGRRR